MDRGASARTFVDHAELNSIGMSAADEAAMRSQGDQVTDGRFDPFTEEQNVQTERYLLDNYLAKHTTFGNI
jgi:hypothetical protein